MTQGLFGGTFDPIHLGHIRLASDVYQKLGFQEIIFLPAAHPLLKPPPLATAPQRIKMLELALKDFPYFKIDDREIKRGGNTATIDTLRDFRQNLSQKEPLCFILSMDQFQQLEHWQSWELLLTLAHLVVAQRPPFSAVLTPNIQSLVHERETKQIASLHQQACGHIYLHTLNTLPISSTEIRQAVQHEQPIHAWVPTNVALFIQQENLYRT